MSSDKKAIYGIGRRWSVRPATALVAAVASVTVGVIVGMPSAQAVTPGVTGYQVVTGTAALLDGPSSVTVSASCPSGQTAVSGGVENHSPLAWISSLQPTSTQTWTATVGQAASFGYTQSVTPYVVCVDTSSVPGLYVVSASKPIGSGQSDQVDAFCQNSAGDVAVAGGFQNSVPEGRTNISAWLPGDNRAWQAGAYNAGSGSDTLTVYAVCLPGADVSDYVQQKNTYPTSYGTSLDQAASFGATTNTSGSPYCPSGDVAIGGGAWNHDQTNAFISSLIPAPQGDPHYWLETSTELAPPQYYNQWAEAYSICVNAVTQAPTTTTLSINPATPVFNQSVTLTATVSPHPGPTGTVTFYDNGVAIGTGTVDSNGVATLTTTFGGGSHSLVATYGGDANYLGSSSSPLTFTIGCTSTITGTHSSFIASSGLTCVSNAHITGGINVVNGAQLDLENTVVSGSISSSSAGGLRICGSTISSITVTKATGFVRIGDPANNCAANTISGGLTAVSNTGGGAVIGNTIGGSWTISSNNPAFTVSGNHH
jgi:hypothetical protein